MFFLLSIYLFLRWHKYCPYYVCVRHYSKHLWIHLKLTTALTGRYVIIPHLMGGMKTSSQPVSERAHMIDLGYTNIISFGTNNIINIRESQKTHGPSRACPLTSNGLQNNLRKTAHLDVWIGIDNNNRNSWAHYLFLGSSAAHHSSFRHLLVLGLTAYSAFHLHWLKWKPHLTPLCMSPFSYCHFLKPVIRSWSISQQKIEFLLCTRSSSMFYGW